MRSFWHRLQPGLTYIIWVIHQLPRLAAQLPFPAMNAFTEHQSSTELCGPASQPTYCSFLMPFPGLEAPVSNQLCFLSPSQVFMLPFLSASQIILSLGVAMYSYWARQTFCLMTVVILKLPKKPVTCFQKWFIASLSEELQFPKKQRAMRD